MDIQTGYGEVRASEPMPVSGWAPLAEVRAAVVVVIGLAAVGAGVGLLWSLLSPRVHVIVTTAGPDLEHYGSDEFFAGDGSFVIITALTGLAAALAVWWLARRWRGPVQLVALAAGCVACGVVAWQVGRHVGLTQFHHLLQRADVGTRFTKPVDLRGKVGLVAAPFTAVISYLVLVSWMGRPDLGVPSVEAHGDLQLGQGDRHGA